MIELTTDGEAVLLPVKIVPGASRTRYMGAWQSRAKIAVAAPPEKGKANKALVAFLAAMFDVRRNDITVVAGQTSQTKTIRIEGVTAAAVRAALSTERS